MKLAEKIVALILVPVMLFGMMLMPSAKEATYKAESAELAGGAFEVKDSVGIYGLEGGYAGFKGVDLTGIKSVTVNVRCNTLGDGDLLLVRIDDPLGKCIGRIDLDVCNDYTDFKGSIEATEGVHDVYFMSLMSTASTEIKSVTFSDVAYEYTYVPADASRLTDKKASTWALTDSLGRRMADYEEVGPLKEGKAVGIFYWTWHNLEGNANPVNNTEFAKKYPEAKYDYNHPAWPTSEVVHYWNEPLFGYYTGADYWVMRKHAVMLANAGVDVMFFDCTNGKFTFRSSYNVLFDALRDSIEDGNEVPKVAFMSNLAKSNPDAKYNLMRTYFGAYHDGKNSDLWYYFDGKPLIMAHPDQLDGGNDAEMEAIMDEIKDFFTFRLPLADHTLKVSQETEWGFLRTFGNTLFGKRDDGTYEMATVGVAVNRSYETGKIDAMNTPYVMGRKYSEGLGDDHTPGSEKYGYFFREQLSAALEKDVDFMFITGWNEWKVSRHIEWNTTKNAFPDQYDNNGSRDMEPTKGELKDIYYCLLVDAVRRFKGAAPLDAASEEKRINMDDLMSWEGVTPEYFNDRGTYKRDSIGFGNTPYKNDSMRNNPVLSKVSRDDAFLYFMAEAESELTGIAESSFMNLYIDSDRNHETGWEGYDYVIKTGMVYGLTTAGETVEKGKAEAKISGKTIQLKIDRALLGLASTLDFEFKWVDNCETKDILDFYVTGNTAPMGRFNYRYSEKGMNSPTTEERKALDGISLVKAGSTKMLVSGKKSDLSEFDSTAMCVEMNGTAYIPYSALTKILGFGRCKAEYNSDYNILFVYHFESDGETIGKYTWVGSTLGSMEARVDGVLKAISAPVMAYNGTVYVPVSLLAEGFGFEVSNPGDGLYAISKGAVSDVSIYDNYFN